jgi:hypothetical protein
MKFTITLDEVQVKALSYVMADPEEWTRNAINERARIAAEELVAQETARLIADSSVTEIPADRDTIILGAPEFVPVETPTVDVVNHL